MEMVTLHELSVLFDISVRVLRSRVRQLVQAGKLVDGQDYRRDDYVDETHFVWKINPASFTRITGLWPVDQPVDPRATVATKSVSEAKNTAAPTPLGEDKTSINFDTKTPGMEREMIDLLKDQVRVKDGQIADLTIQNKSVVALNEKLTGAVVHHTEQIKTLLQLTGGRMEPDELSTRPGPLVNSSDTQSVNNGEPVGDHQVGSAAKLAA